MIDLGRRPNATETIQRRLNDTLKRIDNITMCDIGVLPGSSNYLETCFNVQCFPQDLCLLPEWYVFLLHCTVQKTNSGAILFPHSQKSCSIKNL